MATTNPVLYALQNLQSGRSTGTFRSVRSTPQLSDVGTQRAESTSAYLTDLKAAEAKTADQVSGYDALIASLEESVSGKKSTYENLGTTLTPQIKALQDTYQTVLGQMAPQLTAAQENYNAATSVLPGQLTAAKNTFESSVAKTRSDFDALKYTTPLYGTASLPYAKLDSALEASIDRQWTQEAKSKIQDELVALRFKRTADTDAANAAGTAGYNTYQQAISGIKSSAASAKTAYDATTSAANAQLKAAYDPYSAAASSASAQLDAAYKDYIATSASATTQSKEAFEKVYGEQQRLTESFKAKQAELESQGYLAFAGPSASTDSASPAVSTGSTLAATDLYSNDLESTMLGKKVSAQNTLATSGSGSPEDDIMTGAMQSSIYKA